MSDLTDRFSKKWIYFPTYVIVLLLSIWALYHYLNDAPKIEQEVPIEEVEKVPNSFLTCFKKSRELLGGIFKITPMARLFGDFEKLDSDCYDKICLELESIENGESTAKEFYRIASIQDECFFPILNTSMKYHNEMVEKYTSHTFFYNSGQYNLSNSQQSTFNSFLKHYRNNAKEYKLLIIGRASKVGEERANLALSKKRADQIIDFINNHYIKNLDYDFIYFGANPPQLNQRTAERFGLEKSDYKNISFGSGRDSDYSLRLNQSVLMVIYPKKDDPFGLVK